MFSHRACKEQSKVCPIYFEDPSPEAGVGAALEERLLPSKWLRHYFSDVRQLARTGSTEVFTEQMMKEISSAWEPSETCFWQKCL